MVLCHLLFLLRKIRRKGPLRPVNEPRGVSVAPVLPARWVAPRLTLVSGTPLLLPPPQGIGLASVVIEAYLNVYYIIILSWALFYLFSSFTSELPWTACTHSWNTGTCRVGPGTGQLGLGEQ